MEKLLLFFATLTLATAAAATHRITLYEAVSLNGAELKPGEYKIEVNENKALIKKGKQVVEAAVKVENSAAKFDRTSARYDNSGSGMRLRELRIGGTDIKLVFLDNAASN